MFFIKNAFHDHFGNPRIIKCTSGMQLNWSFLFCLTINWWWKWFKRSVQEKQFCWHNLSHSAWSWQWGANNLDKTESLWKVCMCGVSPQQWASTQITLFERILQSAWLDAVMIPFIRSEWILVYSNTSLEGVEQTNKSPKKTEMLSPMRYQCLVLKNSRLTSQKRSFFLDWWQGGREDKRERV